MPGKRISELTALSGAGSANNDDVVIFDADVGVTKRISRSQLAEGMTPDLPLQYYLGVLNSNPTQRRNGDALMLGDYYLDAVTKYTTVYNGSGWNSYASVIAAQTAAEAARTAAQLAETNAETAETNAAASAVATAADRVQTGLDRTAAEAARIAAQSAAATLGATAYATKTAMDAVTGSSGAKAYVYADATTANNGLYFWSTTTTVWVKDALDTQSQIAIAGIVTLTGVGGSGSAYTATGPANVDREGQFICFTPGFDNTAINPTLTISGGTARPIRGVGLGANNTPIGRIKANAPMILFRVGANWNTVGEWDGLVAGNIAILTALGGTSSAYTATASAPLVNGGTVLMIQPPVENSGALTIAINGGSAIPLLTENGQNLQAGQLKVGARYLAQYGTAAIRVYGVSTPAVDETERVTQEAAAIALPLSNFTSPIEGSANERDPVYVQGGAGHDYWVASVADAEDHLLVAGGTPRYFDLRMLRDGLNSPLHIYVGSGTAKLITSTKIYTASTGAMVRAWQPVPGSWVFDAAGGTVTEGADVLDPAPACDLTLITAGQSHSVLLFNGSGMHGIQRGMRDFGSWLPSIWPIQGATGATGLVPVSGPGGTHWWDPATSAPGPAALAWKAALDAKPSGQPDPAAILWVFGQNDAAKMGTDATMTSAAYRVSTEDLFEWMRDQIDPVVRTPIIWFPLQAYDNDVSPSDAQVSAIRSVMFDMADADADLHVGPIYHDLWHPYLDQHPGKAAQILMGYRLGAQLHNILNSGTAYLGPRVTAIAEESSGASYLLTIAVDAFNPLYWPSTSATIELDGVAVYAAGADPLAASPLTVTRYQRVSSTQLRIYLGTPTANAQVMWPAGAIKAHRAGRYLRSTNNVPVNKGWNNNPPLQPFKSGAF